MEKIVIKALDYLQTKPLLYAPLIEMLRNGEGKILRCDDSGLLVDSNTEGGRMIAAFKSDDVFLRYKDLASKHMFTLFGAENLDFYTQNFPDNFQVPCKQVVYTLKTPPMLKNVAEYRLLDYSYADIINKRYTRSRGDVEYIKKLIAKNYMWGAFIGGELAGFAGRHDDGAMGLLEVFPEYKRQGLGIDLDKLIIGKVLSEGLIPYGHVVFGNDISMHLQLKIEGMVMLPETVLFLRAPK